jgi:hypothetical protein
MNQPLFGVGVKVVVYLTRRRQTEETRGSVMVKALGYKLEGRGFQTRPVEFFNSPNRSGRTRPWGLLSF